MSFRGGGRGPATGANRGGNFSRGSEYDNALNCTRKGTNVFVLSGRGGFQQSFGPPAQVLGNYFIFLYAHS